MPQKFLKNLKPRKYQEDIFKTCINKNCLVVLPTGVGKTLIALMLTINRQEKHPATKTLFLAPTRPLTEQHLNYFEKNLPELFASMNLFTGKIPANKRKELWETSDIIFSTPQCIANDLKKNLYTLEDVSLLIEDESHRCLKNYAYTYVAEKYHESAKFPRVLGLTASPGVDKKTIKQITENLGIESIEVRTRESDDVKDYLQDLNIKRILLEFPDKINEIVILIKNIFNKKALELKNRKLLFDYPNKINLLKLQGKLMNSIKSGNKHFNLLSGVSACTQAIKLSHLIELLETQTLHTSYTYIQTLFEQANNNSSKAVKQIIKNPDFNKAFVKLQELISLKVEHPKLLQLISIIESAIKENPKNKTIIFSQYRETAIKISNELNKIPKINSHIFVGQQKKKESGLSQKEQQQIIEKFKSGEINIICATSIAEEGLDIPEVNSVIFYEPIPSAIRKIQRAGRTARLMKGELIMLVTLGTLDEIFYYASHAKERKMYRSIEGVKKDLDGKNIKPKKSSKVKQKTLF